MLWVLLNATGILNPGETKVPYVAYVFLSNAIWVLFISFYKSISETYTGRGGELLHNNFPHVIIVIEKIIITTFNFAIPMLLSILVLIFYGVSFNWTALLFPLTLVPLMILGIALGLIFSVLKIVALDFTTVFDNSLEILKYITPVVFAANVNNLTLQTIMKYNPLNYLLSFPRSVLLGQGFPDIELYFVCTEVRRLTSSAALYPSERFPAPPAATRGKADPAFQRSSGHRDSLRRTERRIARPPQRSPRIHVEQSPAPNAREA